MLALCLLTTGVVAQCLDDQAHNTSNNSIWMSCTPSTNPLAEIGQTHWILYEFDEIQAIESIHIWNINNPDELTSGAKRIRMDISPDGASWTNMGVALIDMAEASEDYIGQDISEYGSFEAQFVLLTIIENHGGLCSGLSEVRFNLGVGTTPTIDEVLAQSIIVSPNPADDFINISIADIETDEISYQLVDMTGRVLLRDVVDINSSVTDLELTTTDIVDGTYTISMQTDQGSIAKRIIVVHPN